MNIRYELKRETIYNYKLLGDGNTIFEIGKKSNITKQSKQKLERFAIYEQDKQTGFSMIIKIDMRNY